MKTNLRRRSMLLRFVAAACVISGSNVNLRGQQGKLNPTPYASISAVNYAGPGRAAAFDLRCSVIRIGILAPLSGPEKADGEVIVLAAQLALKETSKRALPQGQKLELAIADEAGPSWGRTADSLLRLVGEDKAVAVVTSANGATAHLAEQVGNRIGLPILTLSTDPTTTEIDLPWIFRLGPSDSQLAREILRDVTRRRFSPSVVLVADSDHDGRVGAQEFQKAGQSLGAPPITLALIDPQRPDLDSLMLKLSAHPASAIVLWTRPKTARDLLTRFQQSRIQAPIYLSPQAAQGNSELRLARRPNSREDDPKSDGVWVSSWHSEIASGRLVFEKAIEAQTGRKPSPVAAEAYDAVTLVAEAIRNSGANRARVRDWIARVKLFSGVSGDITFDEQGSNTPVIRLIPLDPVERSSWPN